MAIKDLELYRNIVNKQIEETFSHIKDEKFINALYELQNIMDDYFENVTEDNKKLMDELLIHFLEKLKEENFD